MCPCTGTRRLTISPVLYNPYPLTVYMESCVHRLALRGGSAVAKPPIAKWMRPAMISIRNSGTPLKPTCTDLMPAASLNRSPVMCVELPAPEEPMKIFPGRAWAYAMNSCADLTPSAGDTTNTPVPIPMRVTPAKSLSESYGRSE
jgi:hypothetical protein